MIGRSMIWGLATTLGLMTVTVVAQDAPVRLEYDAGWKAFSAGDYPEAEARFKSAVAKAQPLGPKSAVLASCLHGLSAAYYVQNKYALAEELGLRALAIHEEVSGKDSAEVAGCLNSLGDLRYVQAKYDAAIEHYTRAIAIIEKLQGKSSPETAHPLAGMADVAYMRNKLDEAEARYKHVVALLDKIPILDPRELAHALAGLGNVIVVRVRNEADATARTAKEGEAEALYKRAIEVLEKASNKKDHPESSQVHVSLAGLYYSQRKYDEAETSFRKALTIQESMLGGENPGLVTYLVGLANTLYEKRDLDSAETLYQKALGLEEKAHGPDRTGSVPMIVSLGDILYLRSEFKDAEPLYQRAIAITEKEHGPDSQELASVLDHYALLLRQTDREADAKLLEAKAKGIRDGTSKPKVEK